jgi:poly-gamma-glutamate synthesis protein (capsule biosynthesis protein)
MANGTSRRPDRWAGGAIRVACAGDIGLAGDARTRAEREGHDAALSALASAFASADLAFANLELPVGDAAEVRAGRSTGLRQGPEVPGALARAGVRIVSLANNHILDCGVSGLERTRRLCGEAGLATAGAGRDLAAARAPARVEAGGCRVVLLAYAAPGPDAAGPDAPGVAPLDETIMAEDVWRWRSEADVLLVSVHWGSMYVDYPPPRVSALAERLASLPLDAVIGTHPHVLQGVRWYGAVPVLFSLGDAAFNPRAGDFEATVSSARRRESGVFTLTFGPETPAVEYTPLLLDDDGLPTTPDAAAAAAQRERIRTLSAGLEHAQERFAAESAPTLLRYELQSLGTYVRQGRIDKALRLLGSIRPRHLPLLWQAVRRLARIA